jgi:2-methylcitrate dehydratase
MVAVALLHGELTAASYEDDFALDPRIDALRGKMQVREEPAFTADYYAPDKRAIGNAVQVFFNDGSRTERVAIDYPVGHRRRRAEGVPLLEQKFIDALAGCFPQQRVEAVTSLCGDARRLETTPVHAFCDLLAT